MAKKSSKGEELFAILKDWREKNLDPDPFDDPKYNANFRHWLQMPVWTAHEAITLSLGKDPRKIQRDNAIQSHHHYEPEATFRTQYPDRFEILNRSLSELAVGSVNPRYRYLAKVEPDTFVCWAKGKDWELPKELEELAIATDLLSAESSNPEEFKNVEGLNWGDITLTLLSGGHIEISIPELTKKVPLGDLGLLNRSTNQPNKNFELLASLAKSRQSGGRANPALKDIASELRKNLKAYFGIKSNPLPTQGKYYVPRFQLIDKRDAPDKRAKEKALRNTVAFDESKHSHQRSSEIMSMSNSNEYTYEEEAGMAGDEASAWLDENDK